MKKTFILIILILTAFVIYQQFKIEEYKEHIQKLTISNDSLDIKINNYQKFNYSISDFTVVSAKDTTSEIQNKIVLALQNRHGKYEFKLEVGQKKNQESDEIWPLVTDTVLNVLYDQENIYYFDIQDKYFKNNIVYAILKTKIDTGNYYFERPLEIHK